jgi:hypothetical protein
MPCTRKKLSTDSGITKKRLRWTYSEQSLSKKGYPRALVASALDFMWGVTISCCHQSKRFPHIRSVRDSKDYLEQDKKSSQNPEAKRLKNSAR